MPALRTGGRLWNAIRPREEEELYAHQKDQSQQPREVRLAKSEVSPDSVERVDESPLKQRYIRVRAFSIVFHIPYSTVSTPVQRKHRLRPGERERPPSAACPRIGFPTSEIPTHAHALNPSVLLTLGASNVISIPLSRAKWRTVGRVSRSTATAAVVAVVTASDVLLARVGNSGRGGAGDELQDDFMMGIVDQSWVHQAGS